MSNIFTDLFASKVGVIDAAIETVGKVYIDPDVALFVFEAEDTLIGGNYRCQALLNTDGVTRWWDLTISSEAVGGWRVLNHYSASFKGGKLVVLWDR